MDTGADVDPPLLYSTWSDEPRADVSKAFEVFDELWHDDQLSFWVTVASVMVTVVHACRFAAWAARAGVNSFV